MEACVGAHHLSRQLLALGHDARIMPAVLPEILGQHADLLSPRMERLLIELSGDLRHLDERLAAITAEIETIAKADDACRRLMPVPGIGPVIASAMVSAIGNGSAFNKGRDFAAFIGLVPRQMSTGGRTILGRISKPGNTYLRTLFIRGARVILLSAKNWHKHRFGAWLEAASKRMHRNVLAVALANKLARIAWSGLASKHNYQAQA